MLENPTDLNALCNLCAKIACRSSELIFTFLYMGSCIQNVEKTVRLLYPHCVNFARHLTPQI
jgi:hypothetical protein